MTTHAGSDTSTRRAAPRRMRSVLFAPANHPRKVQRLDDFGADAIVLDLEDAVANEEKVAARSAIVPALANYRHALRCVRVNDLTTGLTFGDLDAVVCADLDAVVLPKTDQAEDLRTVDAELRRLEDERGLEPGRIQLLPLVETAVGIMRAYEIALATTARTPRLIFGLGDFSVDIGVDVTAHGHELLFARSKVVVASRAARLAAPLDGPFLDIHNVEALRADTLHSREVGFQGRVVVYPGQVETVNETYSATSPEDLARARKIVAAFEEAEHSGSASIQVDGMFVDYPLYRRSVELLAAHDSDHADASDA